MGTQVDSCFYTEIDRNRENIFVEKKSQILFARDTIISSMSTAPTCSVFLSSLTDVVYSSS